jgi:hypothetical protein
VVDLATQRHATKLELTTNALHLVFAVHLQKAHAVRGVNGVLVLQAIQEQELELALLVTPA